MTDLPAVRWLLRLVVVLHLVLAGYGLTQRFDHLLHFLGGASIAYFFLGLFASLPAARSPSWVLYLLTFAWACTIAVFWEIAEFASDQFRGTSIQQSVPETMLDLLFGVLGALTTLAGVGLLSLLRGRRTTPGNAGVPPASG
ncbi:MAG: hypothetical protein J0M24_16510 [Verrucomicrobia bacterium]|nr:hypothetical protein [Verrucomicrobiota bacterium]